MNKKAVLHIEGNRISIEYQTGISVNVGKWGVEQGTSVQWFLGAARWSPFTFISDEMETLPCDVSELVVEYEHGCSIHVKNPKFSEFVHEPEEKVYDEERMICTGNGLSKPLRLIHMTFDEVISL